MVITILEAEVSEKNWQVLKGAYAKDTADISEEEGIHQTFLVQSKDQPSLWRIITHWHSQKALDHMRQTVQTPTGVLIFQAAEAKPKLEIWDIETHAISKNNVF